MIQQLTGFAATITFLLMINSSAVVAATKYEFVQEDTNDRLATLEFSSLPGTPNEIVSFSLNTSGLALFGYEVSDQFLFDFSLDAVIDDFNDGLAGNSASASAVIAAANPPSSSFHPSGTTTFQLYFSLSVDPISVFPEVPSDGLIVGLGEWRAIPEPSSLALLGLGGLGILRRRLR